MNKLNDLIIGKKPFGGSYNALLKNVRYAFNDLRVIGISAGNRKYRVAASATIGEPGEPIEAGGTLTSGAASANTVNIAAADTAVIGTDYFLGILAKDFEVNSAGTVVAHETVVTVPIPNASKIRGKAETTTDIDTDAKLLAILMDVTLIDYSSAGAADSGPLYTIKQAASANTSAFTIVDGNIDKGTLDVTVDERAMRSQVA